MTRHPHGRTAKRLGRAHARAAQEVSAAAIAAAGMLRLARTLGGEPAGRYRDYALRILATLRSTQFIAADTPGWQGILRHATYRYRHGLGVDESVMFGDYYFVEALDAASRLDYDGQRGTP